MRQLKVGDKVKLVGHEWARNYHRIDDGDIVTVGRISSERGVAYSAEGLKDVGSLTGDNGLPLREGYEIELIEEPPKPTDLESDGPEIKYAMQLSGVDLGKRIVWIHEYKYDGETREKVKDVIAYEIIHTKKKTNIKVRKQTKDYWGRKQMSSVSNLVLPTSTVAVYAE